MKEPTMKEVLELVSFERDENGKLQVLNVRGHIGRYVLGNVGSVNGHIGSVGGNVRHVFGNVQCVHGNIGMVHGNVSDVFGTIWGTSSDILRDEVVKLNQKP